MVVDKSCLKPSQLERRTYPVLVLGEGTLPAFFPKLAQPWAAVHWPRTMAETISCIFCSGMWLKPQSLIQVLSRERQVDISRLCRDSRMTASAAGLRCS